MVENIRLGMLCGVALPVSASPTLAADVPPVLPKPSTTLTVEGSPEFHAADKQGSYDKGDLADYYFKVGLSHTFESAIALGTTFEHTITVPDESEGSSTNEKAEVSLGYRIKAMDILTITPSAVLGYGFGDEPKIDPDNAEKAAAYYAGKLAVDYKFTPELTWNVVEVRYRDAFDYTWKTPKIQTGFTFDIDPMNAIYLNVGKSWKDNGDGEGLVADKINVAMGWKYFF